MTSANSIIYGHNMKNGTMFSDLKKFADTEFFNAHSKGVLHLPLGTYDLEIIACLNISDNNDVIYNPNVPQSEFIEYIKKNAKQYREIHFNENTKFITLSTCSYEYDGARTVLIAKTVN